MGALKAGCIRAQEWASLELDGGLSELERALLHAHLDRCPTCAAYAASVQAITTQLRAAAVEEPVLAVRPAAARAQRLRVRLLVAAAVVVVAAGLGSLAGALSRSQ